MEPKQVLETANRSERVRSLLATTIQVGARRIFGYKMTFFDAIDLARVHTLPVALDRIRLKLEVHKEIDKPEARFKLAVLETKLAPMRGHGHADVTPTEAVVEIRRKGEEMRRNVRLAGHSQRAVLADLVRLRTELREWSRSYRRFVRELGRLYTQRRRQLEILPLSPATKQEALAKLDVLFAEAIECSRKLL